MDGDGVGNMAPVRIYASPQAVGFAKVKLR